jgi:hypothetical protein
MRLYDSAAVTSGVRAQLLAKNEDSPYLFYCLDTANLKKKGLSEKNIVYKIKAKVPPVANSLFSTPPKVANDNEYDVRYASFSTLLPIFPWGSYESVDAQEITKFYTSRQGPSWDGSFTLVVSNDPGAPSRCGLIDEGREMFLGFRQLPDEGIDYPKMPTNPNNPTIVYRCGRGQGSKVTAKIRSQMPNYPRRTTQDRLMLCLVIRLIRPMSG